MTPSLATEQRRSIGDLPLGAENREWSNYGLITSPVLSRGLSGKSFSGQFKLITQDGKDICIVSNKYTPIPHGFIEEELIGKNDIAVQKTDQDRDGNVKYWSLENPAFKGINFNEPGAYGRIGALKPEQIQRLSITRGDIVGYYATIGNSIDGSSSFHGSVGTIRLACMNGLTSRTAELSFSQRHLGKLEKLNAEWFKKKVESILGEAETLMDYFRIAARVRINQKMAEKLVKLQLPDSYLPNSIEVQRDENRNPTKISVKYPQSAWGALNEATYGITHKSRAGIRTKEQYGGILVNALVNEAVSAQ